MLMRWWGQKQTEDASGWHVCETLSGRTTADLLTLADPAAWWKLTSLWFLIRVRPLQTTASPVMAADVHTCRRFNVSFFFHGLLELLVCISYLLLLFYFEFVCGFLASTYNYLRYNVRWVLLHALHCYYNATSSILHVIVHFLKNYLYKQRAKNQELSQ